MYKKYLFGYGGQDGGDVGVLPLAQHLPHGGHLAFQRAHLGVVTTDVNQFYREQKL